MSAHTASNNSNNSEFYSDTDSPAYLASQHAFQQGCSVIPLQGKKPALKSWKTYQNTHPVLTDLYQWFAVEKHSAYGIICGQISGFVVLDVDNEATQSLLEENCPDLLDTYTVESGGRKLPHYYWRVDFPVKTQKLDGADLRGEGSYVVGAGSEINGKRWTVVNDGPIRQITPQELELVCELLKPPDTQNEWVTHDSAASLSKAQVQKAYETNVAKSKQRNSSLFNAACLARDKGHSEEWTVDALAELHAKMPPQDNHPPESERARYHEAERTIASVFTHPRRLITSPASQIPNRLRELTLQQKDGPATLRVVEGLLLVGYKAGQALTEDEIVDALQDVVGRYSIRKALKFRFICQSHFVEPFFWFCPTYKNACFCKKTASFGQSASAGGGAEGAPLPHRRKIYYKMPSIEAICDHLEIDYAEGDPIFMTDLKKAKVYRQALEREFIKRCPGQYPQKWLASRLGVSDRTIRRYHKAIPIQSCPMYDIRLIHRWNIETLPHDDERQGGWMLLDETGKRHPASYEIAQKLLREEHEVSLYIQQSNFYWYGDLAPHKERKLAPEYVKEPLFQPMPKSVPVVEVNDRSDQSEKVTLPTQSTIPLPQFSEGVAYVRSLDLIEQVREEELASLKTDRYYLKPLLDSRKEHVAQDVYASIDEMSIYNARRLVDLYGTKLVSATLRKTIAMMQKGKIYNPAGFMVAATQGAWREAYGWDTLKPEFKGQPPRRKRPKPYDIDKDPLVTSEEWLRWRVWEAFEMGDQVSVDRWQSQLRKLGLPQENLDAWPPLQEKDIPY